MEISNWLFVFIILTGFSPLNINPNSNTGLIEWIEEHSASVTALGIIVTIMLFVIQEWLKHIENIKKSLNNKFEYIYSLLTESLTRKELLQHQRRNEIDFEIYDFEFPNEVYDKIPFNIEFLIEERTAVIIRDYYNTLKDRNRLYSYRIEVKIANLRDPNDYVQAFLNELDNKIHNKEIYIIDGNNDVIEVLEVNLNIIKKNKQSLRTKMGFRFD